jgi:hypothetical protein
MRKIKIMMMMPLFLAVSLFFAGCGQSVDNDDDDTPTGVPSPDAYLSGGDALYGTVGGIANRHNEGGAPNIVSWSDTVRTIQYTANGGPILDTYLVPDGDGAVYPLVPAGNTLILNALDSSVIQPGANAGTQVVVEGSLYLTNAAVLEVGGGDPGDTAIGSILLNGGRLFVTNGTTLQYGTNATSLNLIQNSASTPALLSGGITFGASGTLSFFGNNGPNNHDILRINPTSGTKVDLSAVWTSSSPANVFIPQGNILSADIFAFPVTADRKLAVYNNFGTGLDDIPGIKSGEQSDPIIIRDGLIYYDGGGSAGKVLEHLDLEVNGVFYAGREIRPKSIKVGPKGVLNNTLTTGLDTSLSVASGGVADLGSLVSNVQDGEVKDVSVETGAVLTISGSGRIAYNPGQIGGTLILTGDNYTVNTAVTGQLEYRNSGGTVSLTDATLANVDLSGGRAAVKKSGASLAVNGDLKLSSGAAVLVGGSRAIGYDALELYDNIWLDGGFTLEPVGGTAARIGLTSDVIIKTSLPVNSTSNLDLERGALLSAGNGTILFTNGADESVLGVDTDDEDVVYNAQSDKFRLGSGSLAVTNEVGFGTLSLTGADIVFGETEVDYGVSLRSGQYIISSENNETGFAIGRLYGHDSRDSGISIGDTGYDGSHSFLLGPSAEIIFGGVSDQTRYLLVGTPYASPRTTVSVDDPPPESSFAIRGIADNSAATIRIPNFLVVGSLGATKPIRNGTLEPLFAYDRFAYSTSDNPTASYSSGDITVSANDSGSLSVQHNNVWTWGSRSSYENNSAVPDTGGWVITTN